MEIDPATISGSWQPVTDDGIEAYVYTEGVMAGLCILGDRKEPCFEGSAFFSTENNEYQKFLQAIANYGGKKDMNEEVKFEEQVEPVEETPAAEEPVVAEEAPVEEIPTEEAPAEEAPAAEAENEEENSAEPEFDYVAEYTALQEKFTNVSNEFETVQAEFAALREAHDARNTEYEALQHSYEELQKEYADLNTNYTALQEKCNEYEKTVANARAQIVIYENAEKARIIEKFSNCGIPADIMQTIVEESANMSVNDLNTRCAVEYTNFSMAKEKGEEIRIPQNPRENSALATILERYKK